VSDSAQHSPANTPPTSNRITSFEDHPAAHALERFRENPRVTSVRLIVPRDACPSCRHLEGEYPKDQVPELPLRLCSHPLGCRSFYEPRLAEIYP
jgi:hypothetical protein